MAFKRRKTPTGCLAKEINAKLEEPNQRLGTRSPTPKGDKASASRAKTRDIPLRNLSGDEERHEFSEPFGPTLFTVGNPDRSVGVFEVLGDTREL
jgi:hypothetical protein